MSWHKKLDLSGTGKALRGKEMISAVEYHLEIYQESIDVSGPTVTGQAPGVRRIVGTITAAAPGSLPIGDRFTLVTREGYTLEFWIKDSSGAITAPGSLRDDHGRPVPPS